jgi:hypothetical protein
MVLIIIHVFYWLTVMICQVLNHEHFFLFSILMHAFYHVYRWGWIITSCSMCEICNDVKIHGVNKFILTSYIKKRKNTNSFFIVYIIISSNSISWISITTYCKLITCVIGIQIDFATNEENK